MTFAQWLFGGIDNPYKAGQWGPLHIATLVTCVALIIVFSFVRRKERARKRIALSLACAIGFFELMIRFVHCMKLYYFHQPEMSGITLTWIILPKPWCAIACWSLIASVFVKKPFFYNFASLSALLCSVVFFVYPGVGYNNEYLLFENWYSILTHALLLTTSITMMVLGYTDFRYQDFWKTGLCFLLTFGYAFLEIYVLRTQNDPMYFMPGGDIQANILRMDYGLYICLYIVLLVILINIPYLVSDKEKVKRFFVKTKERSI